MTTLGWLGTGRMGTAMASRLIDAGYHLRVWNRTRSRTDDLAARGATVVGNIVDLCEAEVVFVTVARPEDLEVVVAGPGGLITGAAKPSVIVDCSTVSPKASAEIRARVSEAGVGFLASPVSGNPRVVADGAACFMASGPIETFIKAQPFLETIARSVVYVGGAEQSRLVKLAHNLYLGMVVQALVEVTTLAEKGGTPRAAFLELLNTTVMGSDWIRERTNDLIGLDWTPTFTTELLRKDFDLALSSARDLEVPLPVGSAVYQRIQSAIGTGSRNKDFLSLYVQQARDANLPSEPANEEAGG